MRRSRGGEYPIKTPDLSGGASMLAATQGGYEGLVRAALLFAAIFALTAIGLAIARRFRDRSAKDKLDRHKMMSNFRELYDRGGLSDQEFRTIKAKLASELKAELNDNSGAG